MNKDKERKLDKPKTWLVKILKHWVTIYIAELLCLNIFLFFKLPWVYIILMVSIFVLFRQPFNNKTDPKI